MTDDRTTELLPCPFCGGEASKRLFYKGKYRVHCNVCDAHSGDVCATKAEAIAAWNTRAAHGTLTAEQVRKAIMDCSRRGGVTCDGGWYIEGEPQHWQRMADRLNALVSDTKPCYATDYTHEHCKYSVNRGWVENVAYGTLTAKQVMAIAGKHQPDYCSDTHVCFDWQAIADELNAELGSGTCEMYRDEYGTWHCKSCESGADTDTGSDGTLDTWCDAWPPNYCPNCGRKVVS